MIPFLSVGIGRFRRFGTPIQFKVSNRKEIFKAIERYNGIRDCFISISEYQQVKNREITIPLFFPCDLDGAPGEQDLVNEDAAKILSWCRDNRISYQLNESGRKGLHVLIPLNLSTIATSVHFKRFYQFLKTTLELKTIDPVCAETKRLIRIPNTWNVKAGRMCTPLEEFSKDDLVITDFVSVKAKAVDFGLQYMPGIRKCPNPFLSFHPCIDKLICKDDVDHKVRWTWVKLCQYHGMSSKEIFNAASRMGWSDFDPEITKYQIEYTLRSDYRVDCDIDYCMKECPMRRRKHNAKM